LEAAQKAISCPLLEEGSIEGARGVLLNITGGSGLTLHEVDEASSVIKEAADPDANIIVGQVINPDAEDELVVTVIATGFDRDESGSPVAVGERSRASRQGGIAALRSPASELAKDLERPAFLRRLNGQQTAQERLSLALDDEWDVPAFLRKHSD
jgi:cell division protein FtsZ